MTRALERYREWRYRRAVRRLETFCEREIAWLKAFERRVFGPAKLTPPPEEAA